MHIDITAVEHAKYLNIVFRGLCIPQPPSSQLKSIKLFDIFFIYENQYFNSITVSNFIKNKKRDVELKSEKVASHKNDNIKLIWKTNVILFNSNTFHFVQLRPKQYTCQQLSRMLSLGMQQSDN